MKKWHKEPVAVDLLRKLNETYQVDYITASMLVRREITDASQIMFVLESDLSYLHNPFLFNEMEIFIERILEAKEAKERICVFGDRDVDGITSTVLLVEELHKFGFETFWRLPEGDEPYGLTKKALDEISLSKVSLVITVDCGISNFAEIEYAKSLGIDVLITDHHIASEELPDAVAIINPKIEESGYPFAHLAGCGVVAKCIWALRFSQTEFYQESFILLHATLGSTKVNNETIIIEAVKIKNLVETERIVEEVIPLALGVHQSRIINFLDCNLPILALDIEIEKKLLKRAFGKHIDIELGELRPKLEDCFPHLKEKSLFSLKQISKSIRYKQKPTELDVLISLFNSFVYRSQKNLSVEYREILDLVALGTIGDLMPMVDENRLLVKVGLQEVSEAKRRGLFSLLLKQNLIGKKLSTNDIGWYVTPIINSSGRMGKPEIGVKLLLAVDEAEVEGYSNQLIELNKQRQSEGEALWERLLPKAHASFEDFEKKFLIVKDKNISRGLTGVMAARLLRQFNVPSLVVAQIESERITGSIRSNDYFNVRDFLYQFDDLLLDYGGHRCAGGFSMETKYLQQFLKRVQQTITVLESYEEQEKPISIDAELTRDYMRPELINIVEIFEPFGEGNPPLHFLIKGAKIGDIQLLNRSKGEGPGHIKLEVVFGEHRWPALYWNGSDEVLDNFVVGDEINLVFRLGRNYFRNIHTLQLTIVAMEKYKTPIEKILRLDTT
ncbi:MAG: single-stranded-DNA-specific exonuclease RecJ [Sphaerochaetaceae bacterium]